MIRRLIVGLLTLLFLSCGKPDALFLVDEAWMVLNGPEKAVLRQFRKKGFHVDIQSISLTNMENQLPQAVESADTDILLFSPLLSGHAGRLAEQFPGTTFIAYGSWEKDNLLPVLSDRREALKETGGRCAAWVRGQNKEGSVTAAVFLQGNTAREEEYQAFMEGWRQVDPSPPLEVKRLSSEAGEDEMDRFLSLSLLDRTVLGVFFAGRYNKKGIDYCLSVDLPVVTEDIPLPPGQEGQPFLVLRESYVTGLIEALQRVKEGIHETVFLPVSLQGGEFMEN